MFWNGSRLVISFFLPHTTTTANFCDHHSRRVVGSIINLQYSEKREKRRVLENPSKSLILLQSWPSNHFLIIVPNGVSHLAIFLTLLGLNLHQSSLLGPI